MGTVVQPHSESANGMNNDLREKVDGEENCARLARSDSGCRSSVDAAESTEQNNLPEGNQNHEDSSDITSEIIDQAQRDTDEKSLVNKFDSPGPSQEMMVLDNQNDQYSGIERSPICKHLTFSKSDYGGPISEITPILQKQDESFNHLQETSYEHIMQFPGELNGNIKGHVSPLTSDQDHLHGNISANTHASNERSKLSRQDSFNFPPSLNIDSFNRDKQMIYEENSSLPPPKMSISSSTSSCSQNYISTYSDKIIQQNRHIQQYSVIPCMSQAVPGNCMENSYLPTSPQDMVAKNIMDQLARELFMAKKKLNEYENLHLQLLQECRQRIDTLQEDVALWKNNYYEANEELQSKGYELKMKQHELEAKDRELESKQRELDDKQRDLHAKQCELDDVREHCNQLQDKNKELVRTVSWLSEDGDDEPEMEPEISASLNMRPSSSSSDRTSSLDQTDSSDQTRVKESYTGT